jgi:hypothetical protein
MAVAWNLCVARGLNSRWSQACAWRRTGRYQQQVPILLAGRYKPGDAANLELEGMSRWQDKGQVRISCRKCSSSSNLTYFAIGNIPNMNLIFMNSCIVVWISRNNQQDAPCNRIYYSNILLKAQHVSSGMPLIIRSSKLHLQPLVYIPIWWPLSRLGGNWVPTQPGQRPVTTWVYKPEAVNTVWSSWWWAVCRSKHVEPSIKFWNNKFYYKVHLVGYFYWFVPNMGLFKRDDWQ